MDPDLNTICLVIVTIIIISYWIWQDDQQLSSSVILHRHTKIALEVAAGTLSLIIIDIALTNIFINIILVLIIIGCFFRYLRYEPTKISIWGQSRVRIIYLFGYLSLFTCMLLLLPKCYFAACVVITLYSRHRRATNSYNSQNLKNYHSLFDKMITIKAQQSLNKKLHHFDNNNT